MNWLWRPGISASERKNNERPNLEPEKAEAAVIGSRKGSDLKKKEGGKYKDGLDHLKKKSISV